MTPVPDGTPGSIRRVLFISHTHAFGSFRVGSHHYARALAQRGIEVVHLSTPISAAHRLTGRVRPDTARAIPVGPTVDEAGVVHLIPRPTLPRPHGPFRVARHLRRQGISPRFDAVLLDQPLLWDTSVRTLSGRLVYRPTDLYPVGTKARLQRMILAEADGVIATSAEVLRGLDGPHVPTLDIPNGVDADRFAAPNETSPRPPVCVYVGALDPRFDWPQVIAWARAMPEVRFVIAGPDAAPPGDLPTNVELPGAIAYDTLPTLLQRAAVGVLPLSDDPLNAGRSPMKLYEYLAAGLSVVATATPVIATDESVGLYAYRDGGEALESLQRALTRPTPNLAGVLRARAEDWDAKADALLGFLEHLPHGGRSA